MNILRGHIVSIEMVESVAIIDIAVAEMYLTATLLGNADTFGKWTLGQQVQVLFNEMEVALAKNLTGLISMRNRLPGVIESIESGQLLTRIIFTVGGAAVSSVITTRSAQKLDLRIGDTIEGLVKSNEMNLRMVES